MKLKKIYNAIAGLQELAKRDLPVSESFKLVKILQQTEPECVNFEIQRNKLLVKYGTSPDGKAYKLFGEKKNEYIKEITPLEDIDIKLDLSNKIQLSADFNFPSEYLKSILDFVELKEGDD